MVNKPDYYLVNVEGAIFHQGRWLLIKRGRGEEHAPGTISLVGGKVEGTGLSQNILEQNLRREIREEVGIEVAAEMEYVESKFFLTDRGEPVLDIVFQCFYEKGQIQPGDPAEIEDIFWLTPEEVNEWVLPEYVRSSLEKAARLLPDENSP
ncbi:MAG: NUDIX domain-containing protein [Halanaerobium sp.]|nr:NUDIX domain-containing protein [Halanaerobium sp.]